MTVGQTSAPQTVTVSNTGTGAASNMSYPTAPPRFTKTNASTCTSPTLNAGASCTLVFTYSPTSATSDSGTYTFTGGGASIGISLSGSGAAAAAAAISVSPSSLSFGSVQTGNSSAPQSVTVTNTGGATATALVLSNNNASEFVVSGNGCASTLAAGASCSLNVTYTPSAAGADSASLTWTYTGGTPVSLPMTGTGTAPATASLSLSPTSLSFGTITVGTTSATQTVTLRNTGGAQATGIALANGNSGEFPVSANTCGATLNAGATCTFAVAYMPSGAGADSASITVSSTGGSNLTVALSGTGTAAPSASLSATPPIASFGNVNVGQTSAPTTITVNNTGGAAATGLALANSNAAEFVVSGNTCVSSVAAGGSCSLSVAYTPSGAGADSATLTLSYSGGGSLSVSMSGTGVAVTPPPGTGQLSMPSALSMPDTTLGASSGAQTVTLSNIGSAAVTVSSITSSNAAEFAVSASTCATVAAGASCTFAVTFLPNAIGARSAIITVASSGTGSPQAIAASGTGVSGTTPPPSGTTITAIEYYHADFDHYFITAVAGEISKLDDGTFKGWVRTGKQFKVYPTAATGLKSVCRFFSTAFGTKSSHFYTNDAGECTTVQANVNWSYEGQGAEIFFTVSPTLTGACPAGMDPVYRMYNNGQGGAPNHRYTTDLATRAQMLAKGWIPEGYGDVGVIMCSPQ